MSMDATLQVRMDGQIKNNVEELYRNLGKCLFVMEIGTFSISLAHTGIIP